MYSKSCLSPGRGSTPVKVAVLDTIHGAAVIAERMVDQGISAHALEVYHHTQEMEGYDLVVAPVHLWPGNPALAQARRLGIKVITHHQAVGEILSAGMTVFEITGTRGKTTTALLLSRVLSMQKRVVSHTTRGIEIWENGSCRRVQSGLSIAPGNVIPALESAESNGAGAFVCEVSLGGTGLADYGLITSLDGDYLIGKGAMWASTAKLQMASLARPEMKLICGPGVKISSEMPFGPGGRVQAERDCLSLGSETVPIELGSGLDFSSYEHALSGSAAAALAFGMGLEDVASGIRGFDGFGGRMKVTSSGGITVYDNSNSGLKVSGVEKALDLASGGSGSLALVVGEESETVCEGMDVPCLVELLRRRRQEIGLLVLVGDRLKPYAGELKADTARNLSTGQDLARSGGHERLVSCVKCFR
ncbi:MAG TPA: coenzyme F430 synthase [Methanotrichaceae archaeon]|nr:coenzyme F430 synthase [Methanotrichaceae archaeon]